MSETRIDKRGPSALRAKGLYTLAFSVIAVMLYYAGFPVFLLFFVGVLTFFIWKVFSSEGRHETRRIFEFYLSANEILRDDGRRWYGFEIQETIERGEAILGSMKAAPPLVYFGLGALYQKLDDHGSAVKHLSQVVDEGAAIETAIVFPTNELREYVRMLRKIERAPAEAPLTSAAIRSLERARQNRGKELLERSRAGLSTAAPLQGERKELRSVVPPPGENETPQAATPVPTPARDEAFGPVEKATSLVDPVKRNGHDDRRSNGSTVDRKTISEVLHDIYDKNAQ